MKNEKIRDADGGVCEKHLWVLLSEGYADSSFKQQEGAYPGYGTVTLTGTKRIWYCQRCRRIEEEIEA